jgi:tetratricopeptide (TPR) repeat protein
MRASLLVATGKLDEARPLVEHQIAISADPLAILDRLQRMLGHAPDPARGLAMVESLAARFLADPRRAFDANLVLSRAARDAGNAGRSLQYARAALDLRSESESSAEASALAVVQSLLDADGPAGKTGREVAVSFLARFVPRHDRAEEARLAYARLLVAVGRIDDARHQFEDLLRGAPDRPEALYALGVLALDGERNAEARSWFERYLAVAPADDAAQSELAWMAMGRVAEGEHHYDEALQWFRKVRSTARLPEAREREAFSLAHLGRIDEGMQVLASLPLEAGEDGTRVPIAQGQLLRDAHRYAESFDLLELALKAHPDDTGLLYESAMSAERLDRIGIMEERLRRVLALQPDAAHAWNALGFTLADRNIRLDEAYQFIDHALSLAPEDGYIIDSMGWVQFRLGRLDAARSSLQRAYRLKQDPDVAAHLGEVLWATGDHAAARDLLLDARRRDEHSEALRETLERLKIVP